jgi:hypothetical protein
VVGTIAWCVLRSPRRDTGGFLADEGLCSRRAVPALAVRTNPRRLLPQTGEVDLACRFGAALAFPFAKDPVGVDLIQELVQERPTGRGGVLQRVVGGGGSEAPKARASLAFFRGQL